MLQNEHFLTEFLCKEALVTFQPITILRASLDSVDWRWKQEMLKMAQHVENGTIDRQKKA